MPRVLLVDDDKKLVPLLARGLRYEGFEVQAATTGEEGLALARAQAPDVVVLDIGMPDLDGFEVCRRLRKHPDVPIIMLTARDEVEDKVKALGLGADDYIPKPFAFEELVARMQARLRRHGPSDGLGFGDIVCDLATREVRRADRSIQLTTREFDLLTYFLQHPRQVLSREALLRNVWRYGYEGDTKVVDVYVGYLRHKLGDPQVIRTIRGIGYILKA